ncbi:MAG: hypothetical protein LBJ47_02780 [Tannerella sp.]|jgi:hypothetical protein|nr:hypothetical protein [Tannerella sp.]
MMNFTPDVIVAGKKMKKAAVAGPRAETLMFIRHFAHTYEFEPEQNRRIKKMFVN